MRWGRDRFPEYVPRPKARRLTEKEKNNILAAMTRAVAASPVLSHLGVRVRALRGRFYVERQSSDDGNAEVLGRITPLLAAKGALLLEVQRRNGSWYEVDQGSAPKLIKAIASDTKGRFHGLGSVDKVLRKSGKGLNRLPVKMKWKCQFVYAETGADCTAQDALFTTSACRWRSSPNLRSGIRTTGRHASWNSPRIEHGCWCDSRLQACREPLAAPACMRSETRNGLPTASDRARVETSPWRKPGS